MADRLWFVRAGTDLVRNIRKILELLIVLAVANDSEH